MKRSICKQLVVLIVMLCFGTIQGQDEQPRSISKVDYMKVSHVNIEKYLAVERVWRKIHQSNIKAGKYQYWSVQEVLSPSGQIYDYNYVTRISFENEEQYSAFVDGNFIPENIDNLLSKDEMKVFDATAHSRTLVKSEVWQLMDEMLDGDNEDEAPRYSKFNYFVINEGYTPDDFVEVQSIWSPVHEARIKDDKLEAWVVLRKLMPSGTMFDERYATVDHYKSMEALMLDDPSRYFDMLGNAEEAFEKTAEGANLARQEIRRNVMDSN